MANQGEKSNGVENEIDPFISVGTEIQKTHQPLPVRMQPAKEDLQLPAIQGGKKGFRCKHCKLVERLVSLF